MLASESNLPSHQTLKSAATMPPANGSYSRSPSPSGSYLQRNILNRMRRLQTQPSTRTLTSDTSFEIIGDELAAKAEVTPRELDYHGNSRNDQWEVDEMDGFKSDKISTSVRSSQETVEEINKISNKLEVKKQANSEESSFSRSDEQQQQQQQNKHQVNGACWSNQSSMSTEVNLGCSSSATTSTARLGGSYEDYEERNDDDQDQERERVERDHDKIAGCSPLVEIERDVSGETKAAPLNNDNTVESSETPLSPTISAHTTATKRKLRSATKILAFFSRRLNKSSENSTGCSGSGSLREQTAISNSVDAVETSGARKRGKVLASSSIVKFSRQRTADSLGATTSSTTTTNLNNAINSSGAEAAAPTTTTATSLGYLSDGSLSSGNERLVVVGLNGSGGGNETRGSNKSRGLTSRLRSVGLASRLFASKSTHSLASTAISESTLSTGAFNNFSSKRNSNFTNEPLTSEASLQNSHNLNSTLTSNQAAGNWTLNNQRQQQHEQLQQQPAFIVPKLNTLKLPIVCRIKSVDGKLMREIFVHRYELGQYLIENLKAALNIVDTKYFGLKLAKSIDEQEDQRQPWIDLNECVCKQIKTFSMASSTRPYDPRATRSMQNISSSSAFHFGNSNATNSNGANFFSLHRNSTARKLSKLGSSITSVATSSSSGLATTAATKANQHNLTRQATTTSPLTSTTTCRAVDIYLRIKFYPPNLTRIQDSFLRQYLWLQLRRDLRVGKLTSSVNNLTLLMALILQYDLGDYKAEYVSGKLPQMIIMPNQDLIEEQAVDIWSNKLRGLKQHQAQMQFLRTSVILETYGFDYWQVRDHQRQRAYLLGFNYAGVKTIRNGRIVNHFRWHNISKIAYERRMIIFHTYADENSKRKQILGFKCLSNDDCHNLYMRLLEQKYFFTVDLAYFDKSSVRRPSYLQPSVEVASLTSAGSDEAQNAEIGRILSNSSALNSRRTSYGTNEDYEAEDGDGELDEADLLPATRSNERNHQTGSSAPVSVKQKQQHQTMASGGKFPARSGGHDDNQQTISLSACTPNNSNHSTDQCGEADIAEHRQSSAISTTRASSSGSGAVDPSAAVSSPEVQHRRQETSKHLQPRDPSALATQYNCHQCCKYADAAAAATDITSTEATTNASRQEIYGQSCRQQRVVGQSSAREGETSSNINPTQAPILAEIDSVLVDHNLNPNLNQRGNEIYSNSPLAGSSSTTNKMATTKVTPVMTQPPEGSIGQPDCAFCVGLSGGPAPPSGWSCVFPTEDYPMTAEWELSGQQVGAYKTTRQQATLTQLAESILTEPANAQLRCNLQRQWSQQQQQPQPQLQRQNSQLESETNNFKAFTIHSAFRVLIVILVMNFLLRLTDCLSNSLIDLLTTSNNGSRGSAMDNGGGGSSSKLDNIEMR